MDIFTLDVFTPDIEFLPSDREHQLTERSVSRRWEKITVYAAAVAVTGVLAFCKPPVDLTEVELHAAVVRSARPAPSHVPIRPEHLKVIEDYRARHVEMPLTDADRRIRPDYGI